MNRPSADHRTTVGLRALLLVSLVLWTTGLATPVATLPQPDEEPWLQVASLVPADVLEPGPYGGQSMSHALFGFAMAASGDEVAVSADNTETVYLFKHEEGAWRQTAAISGDYESSFGQSLALDGDVLVVGAPHAGYGNGQEGHGSAYVFERGANGWELAARLSESPDPNDEFGSNVAVDGDVIAVGAPIDASPTGGFQSGSAFIYERTSGSWTLVERLQGERHALLGFSVALQDGMLAVSALRGDPRDAEAGIVLLYEREASGWTHQATILPAEPTVTFGYSIDLDAPTLLIGAAYSDHFASDALDAVENAGSAYVYERRGGAWQFVATLTNPDLIPGGDFGWRVALDGDLAVVGAKNAGAAWTGAAYAYHRAQSSWEFSGALLGEDTGPGDELGWSVEVSAGLIFVGAPFDDNRRDGLPAPLDDQGDLPVFGMDVGEDAGSVYVFAKS